MLKNLYKFKFFTASQLLQTPLCSSYCPTRATIFVQSSAKKWFGEKVKVKVKVLEGSGLLQTLARGDEPLVANEMGWP